METPTRKDGVLSRPAMVGEVCSHPKCGIDLQGVVFPSRLRELDIYCSKTHRLQDQVRLKQQRWREVNPEGDRWIKILRRFGITEKEWKAQLRRQGGKCPICGTKDPRQRQKNSNSPNFHTDHTEEHGFVEVRGLLCSPCNQGLGYFQENPELLRSALRYLAEWPKFANQIVYREKRPMGKRDHSPRRQGERG
jgi:hypothetical protein